MKIEEAFADPVDMFFNDEYVFKPGILFVSKKRANIIEDDGIHDNLYSQKPNTMKTKLLFA